MSEPTLPLNDVGQAFWDRHYTRLTAAGLLTAADVDAFTMCCVLWSKLAALSASPTGPDKFREMVQLNQLQKAFYTYAREYGLLPRDRKRSKLDGEAPPAKDQFGL